MKSKFIRNVEALVAVASHTTVRRAALLGTTAVAAAIDSFASTGTLAVTQGLARLSAEFQGPLAYVVATAGLAILAADFFKHREIGAIGWSGVGLAGAAGFMMSAPSLLSLFGVSAFLA